MKRILLIYLIPILFSIIFCLILIAYLIFNVNSVMCFIKWEKADTISLLTSSIIPALLTAIFALIGFFYIESRDIKERKINGINNNINAYNLIMIKSVKRCNYLMLLFINLIQHKNRFEKVPYFNNISKKWETNSRKMNEYSSSDEFRQFVNTQIIEFIKNINKNDSILIYMRNMKIIPQNNVEIFINDDSIFIFKLRDLLKLNDSDNRLLSEYSDKYGTGKECNRIIDEYNEFINDYKMILPNKYDIELFDRICGVIFGYYHLLEIIITEVLFLCDFMKIIVGYFRQYHIDKQKKYKILDDVIKPFIVNERINELKEYIDIQNVYELFKINIKDTDKKMI